MFNPFQLVGDVIKAVASPVTQFLENKKEVDKAKHEMKLAGINNRTRLLMSELEANHEWEMKALETSPKGLKYFSFSMFSAPIIATIVAPSYGATLWTNLDLVPQWFTSTWVTINGAVWGLASLKDSGVSLKGMFNRSK